MAAGWFELGKAKNGKFHFSLKAGNAEIILTSEMYDTLASARNGIASVQKNSSLAERFECKTATNGKFYFVLKAGNHQIIGNSQMYADEKARDKGIASVQANGATPTIKEAP
jgi:uncharacterized protein YegP (UPF0339 family)